MNESCKSHGKPHPNCRCWTADQMVQARTLAEKRGMKRHFRNTQQFMAEGGEAGHFCSETREHKPDCEYFAGGGDTIPDDAVVLDQPAPDTSGETTANAAALSEMPNDKVNPGAEAAIPDDQVVPDEIPDDAVTLDQPQEPGMLQKGLASYGNYMQGVLQTGAGPVIPWVEKHLGMDPQKLSAMANTPEGDIGQVVGTVAGPLAAGIEGAGAAAARYVGATKLGTALIKGAIAGASFSLADDMTKAVLGQPGADPEQPVAAALVHATFSGIMGTATGGIFSLGEGLIGKGLETIKSDKMVSTVENYLAKLGESKDPLGDLGVTEKVSKGLSKTISGNLALGVGKAVSTVSPEAAAPASIAAYNVIQSKLAPVVEKITGRVANKANPYVTDAIIKSILTEQTSGLPYAVHYGTQILHGVQKTNNALGMLFKAAGSPVTEPATEWTMKKIKKFLEAGGVSQQVQNQVAPQPTPPGYAEGGYVAPQDPDVKPSDDKFAAMFPEQNQLFNTAKGRISGYLNSIRPLPNAAKLPFDENPSQKTQEKEYDRAIQYAANPLSILNKVNDGSLTPQDMKHFSAMYPEVHRYLSGEMTKRIMKLQTEDGQKPPFGKRQAMSLFLGSNLDSSLTPAAIMAAQNVYAQKQAAQQGAPAPKKKGKGSLSKTSESYQTAEQARMGRQQKG